MSAKKRRKATKDKDNRKDNTDLTNDQDEAEASATPGAREAARALLEVGKYTSFHSFSASDSEISDTSMTDVSMSDSEGESTHSVKSGVFSPGNSYANKLKSPDQNRSSLESTKSNKVPPQVKKFFPPIIVPNRQILTDINRKFGNVTATTVSRGFRIAAWNEMSYRSILDYLAEHNIEYIHKANVSERQIKVVVKGLPSDMPIDEVEDFLKTDLGTDKVEVYQMSKRVYFDADKKEQGKKKIPLPLFLIKLPDAQTKNKLLKMNHICCIAVRFDDFRPPRQEIVQCHRCQNYHHNAYACNLSPRCVKCAQSHFSNQCRKARDQPPTCCNCSGQHPANYRGCEAYKRIVAAKRGFGNAREREVMQSKQRSYQATQDTHGIQGDDNKVETTKNQSPTHNLPSTSTAEPLPVPTQKPNTLTTPTEPNNPAPQENSQNSPITPNIPSNNPRPKRPLTPKQYRKANIGVQEALLQLVSLVGNNSNMKVVMQYVQGFLDRFFKWVAGLAQTKTWNMHTQT